MRYQGVFFDFDYTLGDSTLPVLRGYREGFRAVGLPEPSEAQVRRTIGMTLENGYAYLTGDRDPGRTARFSETFQHTVGRFAPEEGRRYMVENTTLFPGAAALLRRLKEKGVKTAVVSTKPGVTLRGIFERQRLLDQLDVIVGGEEVARAKPDPEGLERAMEVLGLRPEETLFCGDTVIDAAAARNAGTDFCAVLNGVTAGYDFRRFPCVHIAGTLDGLGRWLGI